MSIKTRLARLEAQQQPSGGRSVIRFENDWRPVPTPPMVGGRPDPDYQEQPGDRVIRVKYVRDWRAKEPD